MKQSTPPITAVFVLLCVVAVPCASGNDDEKIDLGSCLVFHAPFDGVCDANLSGGSGQIYTAETLAREKVRLGNQRDDVTIVKNAGKFGDALHFAGTSKQVLFYRGDEITLPRNHWSGTISLWLKLDPDKDLQPGFCDPFQMTQKKWNDACLFVDFDKELPRDFRLGVFSDYKRWNPTDTAWDQIPVEKRPMVTVKKPPFSSDSWTHVVFTIDNANPADDGPGSAALYLNGQHRGTLRQPMHFTWDQDKVAIMLGINYIGSLDDMAIFNRSLGVDEVRYLYRLPRGASSLR